MGEHVIAFGKSTLILGEWRVTQFKEVTQVAHNIEVSLLDYLKISIMTFLYYLLSTMTTHSKPPRV